ncbi:MAG TPA: hypothetical protein DCM68_04480 [Verrucomicrobia bacterium]|nr:hypothetical protein [Verrucomicrobiota bacterium]
MELELPDPITNYNRKIARQRYLRREEFVLVHHPGFNLAYWQRISRAPARVERLGRHLGWTPDQIKLTKALLVSRMACVFIDHLITRMEQADIIPPSADAPHLEWEHQYRNFLLLFLRNTGIHDRREIVKLMQRLHRYTMPPESLIRFRQHHWRWIERLLPPLMTPSGATDLFIRRQFGTHHDPATAARRICFTASLYSDIQERLYHQQWMYAYSDCMLRLYSNLRKFPDILVALIELK